MPNYVCLVRFTQEGIRKLGATTRRSAALEANAKELGATIHQTYWTVGQYDLVHILEAPDDETAAALVFSLGALGNVRTETLRAFSGEEMEGILEKVQSPYDLLHHRRSEEGLG